MVILIVGTDKSSSGFGWQGPTKRMIEMIWLVWLKGTYSIKWSCFIKGSSLSRKSSSSKTNNADLQPFNSYIKSIVVKYENLTYFYCLLIDCEV